MVLFSNPDDSLKDELTCTVCLDIFMEPHLLPCGHNFCLLCLEELCKQQESGEIFRCPECRQEYGPKIHILQSANQEVSLLLLKNYKLANIAEEYRKRSQSTKQAGITKPKNDRFLPQRDGTQKKKRNSAGGESSCSWTSLLLASLGIFTVFIGMEFYNWSCEKMESEMARKHAVDVTLDPNTAHPRLILSEGRKRVRLGYKRQALPDNQERFDNAVCVLGKDGFTSGRHYWEVEVGKKTEWILGVARESINRKGQITASPENGYWTVGLQNRNEYSALSDYYEPLALIRKPRTVGVYVDYEAGQVSFYNVEARSHIYTFIDTFTGKLYPFFYPGLHHGSKNAAPLIISQ